MSRKIPASEAVMIMAPNVDPVNETKHKEDTIREQILIESAS